MPFFKGFRDIESLKNLPRKDAIAAYNRQFFRQTWHWRSIIHVIVLWVAARTGHWLDGIVNAILFAPALAFIAAALWGGDVHGRVQDEFSD